MVCQAYDVTEDWPDANGPLENKDADGMSKVGTEALTWTKDWVNITAQHVDTSYCVIRCLSSWAQAKSGTKSRPNWSLLYIAI